MAGSLLSRLFTRATEALDQRFRWYTLPLPLEILILIGLRMRLRERNLYDTSSTVQRPPKPEGVRHLTARTVDGTFNDLDHPPMGSAKTRFGRNVPLEHTYPDNDWALLNPNPRTVSRELLTRDSFRPATTLNLLAAAWLQFMIRDWFSHGKSEKENPWKLELSEDDPWPQERPMHILRTRKDPTRSPHDTSPPTYLNTETHWWDGSQIYGSNAETQAMVRSGEDGKLVVDPDGSMPDALIAQASQEPGFWIGLALMQTIFMLEHNAICDRLRAEYPSWSDDDLFDHARLVNAALLAKIHTVEWTTAILGHPALQIGMRANWWGIAGERIYKLFGRVSRSEVISGIPGSTKNHFGVPYSITEEFVAVYRMHPLIPDDFHFRSAADDLIQARTFREVAGRHVPEVLEQVSVADLLYSFGIAHPGAITLHNYPRFLQEYERPDGRLMDLAATDILRAGAWCAALQRVPEAVPPPAGRILRGTDGRPDLGRGDAASLRRRHRPGRSHGRPLRGAEARRIRVQRHGLPRLYPHGIPAVEQRPVLHHGLQRQGLHPGRPRLDRRKRHVQRLAEALPQPPAAAPQRP
jgi:hypothetical protein